MRIGTVWVAVVILATATGWAQGEKNSRAETLARWHFAGEAQLRELKNQKGLQTVLNLPETAQLRDAALTAFGSQAAARFAGQGGNQANPEIAGRIRELLADVWRFETKFLMAGAPGGDADWALGIKLPREREEAWRRQMNDLARGAGLQIREGAEWSATGNKYHLSLVREGRWTLLRGGYSERETKLFSDFRKSLGKGRGKEILSAELNFPRLGEVWKSQRLSHAPRMVINGRPNRDGIRSEVELEYPRELGIKPEKWNVPAGIFREPLIGFAAIQGVREPLQSAPAIQPLGMARVPNQLFAWSVADTPFSSYVAADVGNPKEVVKNIAERIAPRSRQEGPLMGGYAQVSSNGMTVAWRGLPVAVPFARVAPAPASNFLIAGLFPVASTNPASLPKELLQQLNKKNSIYYEWEITAERLKQWRPIWQFAQILSNKLLRSDAVSERWLAAVTPQLGNTITEATLDGTRRIRVVRQSHVGFNALELVLLAHQLDPGDVREPTSGRPGGQRSQAPQAPARNVETGR